ncbi:oxalurate catabolism protein HpxX [Lonsdalea quercina]|uniref:oxalurate catabolism protein HpxX n=1 Tax=Lonsdalea quercina TaxID=71657 RepID=UPI003976EF82
MSEMKIDDAALADYLRQMETMLALELDPARREELQRQFSRIADMALPLMAFPLDEREEIAGVYQL